MAKSNYLPNVWQLSCKRQKVHRKGKWIVDVPILNFEFINLKNFLAMNLSQDTQFFVVMTVDGPLMPQSEGTPFL